MVKEEVEVVREIGDSDASAEVHGVPAASRGNRWVIDEFNSLRIRTLKEGGEWNPGDSYEKDGKTYRFYIKIKSGFKLTLSMESWGWTIGVKGRRTFGLPQLSLLPRLSKNMDKWYVKFLVCPFEMALKAVCLPLIYAADVVLTPVACFLETLNHNGDNPGNTCIEVGVEEEG